MVAALAGVAAKGRGRRAAAVVTIAKPASLRIDILETNRTDC
jgi:hypothetical protein